MFLVQKKDNSLFYEIIEYELIGHLESYYNYKNKYGKVLIGKKGDINFHENHTDAVRELEELDYKSSIRQKVEADIIDYGCPPLDAIIELMVKDAIATGAYEDEDEEIE